MKVKEHWALRVTNQVSKTAFVSMNSYISQVRGCVDKAT